MARRGEESEAWRGTVRHGTAWQGKVYKARQKQIKINQIEKGIKSMKTLKITVKGIAPLLMHSCQCVNPLHPIAQKMVPLKSKRKKTEEDLIKLADLEWEGGLYWNDNIGLYMPSENIESMMKEAAKTFKKGKDVQKYIFLSDPFIPFDCGEEFTKEKMINDYRYRDSRCVNVMRSKILRTRPRFNFWRFTFDLNYDETGIDVSTIVNILNQGGKYVGLGDYRPRYGTFEAIVEEID